MKEGELKRDEAELEFQRIDMAEAEALERKNQKILDELVQQYKLNSIDQGFIEESERLNKKRFKANGN